MKQFIAVVSSESGKISKYQDFDTQEKADAHIIEYGGFVGDNPGGGVSYWVVDEVAETISLDQAQADLDAINNLRGRFLDAINALRDAKKNLPILSEGYQVDPGTLSTGAMAVEIFAYSKGVKDILT
ncbi:MAG: hypothetical protein V3T82_07890, partial [Nitrospinaceae bacterium]